MLLGLKVLSRGSRGLSLSSGLCAFASPFTPVVSFPLQVPKAQSQSAAMGETRKFANKHSKKALKASLTLGILLGMFFVAWLPFFVANVAQVSPARKRMENPCP